MGPGNRRVDVLPRRHRGAPGPVGRAPARVGHVMRQAADAAPTARHRRMSTCDDEPLVRFGDDAHRWHLPRDRGGRVGARVCRPLPPRRAVASARTVNAGMTDVAGDTRTSRRIAVGGSDNRRQSIDELLARQPPGVDDQPRRVRPDLALELGAHRDPFDLGGRVAAVDPNGQVVSDRALTGRRACRSVATPPGQSDRAWRA